MNNFFIGKEFAADKLHGRTVFPRLVEGTLSLKSSTDGVGDFFRRNVETADTDDTDEGIVVEENINMFHGGYFQAKQNPAYMSDDQGSSSDEDVSGRFSSEKVINSQRRQMPTFLEIFTPPENVAGRNGSEY